MTTACELVAAARSAGGAPWDPGVANLSALAHRQLRRRGDQPYLTYYDDASGERTELSYATFDNWSSKTANLLVEEFGVAPGDHVASALDSSWIAVVAAFACWKVGATLWPLPRDALRDDPALPDLAVSFVPEDLVAALPDSPDLIAVGAGFAGRVTADADEALAYGDEVPAFADDYDDPGVELEVDALAVPGARGAPVRWDQRGLLAVAEALGAWGLSERDRLLCALSPARVDGLVLACLGAFAAGASVVLVRDQDPGGFWKRAAAERVTLAALPPAVLGGLTAAEVPGFRGFLAPAHPGPPRLGAQRVFRGLGVVEVAHAATLGPARLDRGTDDWLAARGAVYAGHAGCPSARAQVAVLGAGDRPAAPGTHGELAVRGPVAACGHWAREDLDRQAYAGGWLHSGRRGVVELGPDGREHVFVTAG